MPTGGDYTKYEPKLREKPLPGGDDMTPGAWADLCNGLMEENKQLRLLNGGMKNTLATIANELKSGNLSDRELIQMAEAYLDPRSK